MVVAGNLTFFQSQAFGEFQEKIPYRGKSWMLRVLSFSRKRESIDPPVKPEDDIKASCLVIRQKLPLGYSWLWVPYGPLGFHEEIFEGIAQIAKKERAVFARIEPPLHWDAKHNETIRKNWRIASAKKRYTPEHTLILDIEKGEGEILAQMKPKGRYNIGVAEKHGVCVEPWNGDKKSFDEFYEIMRKTGERDEFGIHPKFFYAELLKTFGDDAILFLAKVPYSKVLAGIIVVFYKGTATYYYGASDHKYRNLMAPYSLQWEAIREAKRRGMKHYDFLGISPSHEKNHSWSGVTEFKKKFGGREVNYPPAFDIVFKPLLYKILLLR